MLIIVFILSVESMKSGSQNATSEANGMHDLKTPLLQTPQDITVREVKFTIKDISCASCVNSVESVVRNLNGVNSVMVSALNGKATIKYVPEVTSVSNLFISCEFN